MTASNMEEIVSLCKRRGFIFPGSEIYGGLKGTYDYGPLGVELKNNIKKSWWNSLVYERDDIEGLEASLISHNLIWKYSGHEATFADPLVDCKDCKHRMRQDKMKDPAKCDKCGSNNLTEPRDFNLLFPVNIGPVVDDSSRAYLRAETAQGTYINFKNVLDSTSRKLPFGIAQVGKSFRNEIVARNFIFRTREFEQMEMQYFIKPGENDKYFKEWRQVRWQWWLNQGVSEENLKWHKHDDNELIFYANQAYDIEYKFPHGFDEVEGIHDRTDYDLGSHTKNQDSFDIQAKVQKNTDSNTKLSYTEPDGKSYIPFVVETAAGVGRAMITILCEAYNKEKLDEGKERIVLKLKPHLAPIKIAVMPLAKNNPDLVNKAKEIKNKLQNLSIGRVLLENSGNIGKNYRRHDEIGTPICITVDYETLENKPESVTLRFRDTMEQKRVKLEDLEDYIKDFYKSNV